ncbi:hypothetical protein [Thalassomonas sp. RHCl1]|uniref:hypothetical protein n=1 Tax=Thalassomonas sp. RHCl1 TaxID=2995320 RepID=UPI00248B3214|nr:hypothetical protein [Thalassomonas sp. RHCl1]
MMLNKKSILGAFSALMMVSGVANAGSGWSKSLYDIDYQGTITYTNAGRTFEYSHLSDDYQPVINKAAKIQAMESALSDSLEAMIRAEVSGELSLRNYSFSLNGPVQLILTGRADGTINARFGGFSVHSSGKLRKNSLIYAHYSLDTNAMWVNGDYNMFTGKISNVTVDNSLNVDFDVDIDSIFDFIPFFNALVTQELEDDFVSEAQSAIYSELNAASNYETIVFGLNELLPDDVYVHNDEVTQEVLDLAEQIKGHFTELVSGESISITLSESEYVYRGTDSYYRTYMIDKVTFDVSNHLFLEFLEVPRFRTQWTCFEQPCDIIP